MNLRDAGGGVSARPARYWLIIVAGLRHDGLDKCGLAFYKDGDIGNDGEWDNGRLEGRYFRGHPHVHVWVNVPDDLSVQLNA
jgi:hypothetical protein